MLQCVAVCCSGILECCSVLQKNSRLLQCAAVKFSGVAVCCNRILKSQIATGLPTQSDCRADFSEFAPGRFRY